MVFSVCYSLVIVPMYIRPDRKIRYFLNHKVNVTNSQTKSKYSNKGLNEILRFCSFSSTISGFDPNCLLTAVQESTKKQINIKSKKKKKKKQAPPANPKKKKIVSSSSINKTTTAAAATSTTAELECFT